MEKNPFTLMYGIAADSVVNRTISQNTIIDAFTNQNNMFAYLITGVRGSGKTVLLRTIEKELDTRQDWVVVNINPQGDILASLANQLYDAALLHKLIGKWSLTINLEVLTLTRENGEKTSDPEIIIGHIVEKYRNQHKKILISIDEVNDTAAFRRFINSYQTLIGKQYPLYLLMTALKENVRTLINDKAMTFLSRTPKIELGPLDLVRIATAYQAIFRLDDKTAVAMAKLTNGYAFAYQVLGYFFYETQSRELNEDLLSTYEKYLWNNGYSKFYYDLTWVEKRFVISLALSTTGTKEEILSHGVISPSNYTVYRARLIEKGLISSPKYGSLAFVLPRFKEFVLFMKEFEGE